MHLQYKTKENLKFWLVRKSYREDIAFRQIIRK